MKQSELLDKFKSIEQSDTKALLKKALELFPGKIALASSFSMEDAVLIDMLMELDSSARVFALDTGRLNDETYRCAEDIRAKYNLKIEWYFPKHSSVEQLVQLKGLYSFRESIENRKECCGIRKVEPLNRALKDLSAWITGQRKAQSQTRAELAVIEIDSTHGDIAKLNPLANWSFEQVKNYVSEKKLPYNSLYDRGYASIGCAPCTRAVKAGEDERAGRWWWENPEHKECGLHVGAIHESPQKTT